MSGIPRISVLMPVFNAGAYLDEAVKSVLNQTYPDFEFIIIDDGSTDTSAACLDQYEDQRIVRVRNSENRGVSGTLNQSLELARGEFIARMDADDIAHPLRFEKQVAFLESQPEVGVLGTAVTYINAEGHEVGSSQQPVDFNNSVWTLVFGNPFIHPTVMARADVLARVGGYTINGPAQDRDLWIRLYRRTKFANLSEPLLKYRLHDSSVTSRRRQARRGLIHSGFTEPDYILRQKFLRDLLGRDVSLNEVEWITLSQKPQTTIDSGLSETQIEIVVSLLLEVFNAFVEQELFVGDYSNVKQDLVRRIIAASRYSPQCVMPGRLARQWRHPLRRRLLLALRMITKLVNLWPEHWN